MVRVRRERGGTCVTKREVEIEKREKKGDRLQIDKEISNKI